MQLLHKRVRVSVRFQLGQCGESFNRQKLFELRCTHNYQENSNAAHMYVQIEYQQDINIQLYNETPNL